MPRPFRCAVTSHKKKRPWSEDLLFSSCNFTGSFSSSSLLPPLSEQRYVVPFFVDSTTSHPYERLSSCTQRLPLQERPERSYALALWIGGGLQWKLSTTIHTQILRQNLQMYYAVRFSYLSADKFFKKRKWCNISSARSQSTISTNATKSAESNPSLSFTRFVTSGSLR
jgi:hypothetical protein